jgi:hypothetical protein
MDFSLADEEIRLLKELKGAGELGRIFPQAQSVLARLIRAGYVKRRVIKLSGPICDHCTRCPSSE